MLRHKHIDRICCIVLALTLLCAALFMGAAATGAIAPDNAMGYETRLFSDDSVHVIDVEMDDWDAFIATCPQEAYAACTVNIDGERYAAAIRGKGNTSLSSVASMGSQRYSFKVEFDHYQSGASYHGLDKLSLNNLIQDNTCMKDYLAYTLMRRMGVAAPLCSFVQLRVNGEPWGLYLAVEGVEDSFLRRHYGNDHGELYKPDSMSFGGGRGNGRDFIMKDFAPGDAQRGGRQGGMGASDVKLQYAGDDPAAYSNIFDNAKTDASDADKARLIASLKALGEGDASAVDQEALLRYLVVHSFLCNDDSYTGTMVHNYYLYEDNGVLSMIPWDYNLAFGSFGGGDATSQVNAPIDTPVTGGSMDDRPMVAWVFGSQESVDRYHALYRQFADETLASGWLQGEIDRVTELIAPYVAADPTAFCTAEEFRAGVATLSTFCDLRMQSIAGQLAGTIPSTQEGQRGASALIDATGLNLSDMGSMEHGGGDFGGRGGFQREGRQSSGSITPPDGGFPGMQGGAGMTSPDGGFPGMQGGAEITPPDGVGFPGMQGGAEMTPPDGGGFPGMQGGTGMTPPDGTIPGAEQLRTEEPLAQNGNRLWLLLACVGVLALALAAVRFSHSGR